MVNVANCCAKQWRASRLEFMYTQMGQKLWRVLQWEGPRLKSLTIWRKGIFWALAEGSSLLLVDVWVHTCIATCGNPIKSVSGGSGRGGGGHANAQLCTCRPHAPAAPLTAAVDYTITGGRFVPATQAKIRRCVSVNVIIEHHVHVVRRPSAGAPTGHVTLQFLTHQDGANKRYLCL